LVYDWHCDGDFFLPYSSLEVRTSIAVSALRDWRHDGGVASFTRLTASEESMSERVIEEALVACSAGRMFALHLPVESVWQYLSLLRDLFRQKHVYVLLESSLPFASGDRSFIIITNCHVLSNFNEELWKLSSSVDYEDIVVGSLVSLKVGVDEGCRGGPYAAAGQAFYQFASSVAMSVSQGLKDSQLAGKMFLSWLALHSAAADCDAPFVVQGGGAPKGLSHEEHVIWSAGALGHHPERFVSPDMLRATLFELKSSVQDIDAYRQKVVDKWIAQAEKLQARREEMLADTDPSIRELVAKLHLPLIEWLVQEIVYEDPLLLQRCTHGFPFVGDFDPCLVDVQEALPKMRGEATEESLRRDRGAWNQIVLDALVASKVSDFEEDIHQAALDDAAEGYMTTPVPLEDWHVKHCNLTRRMAVREFKLKAEGVFEERTRTVDHETESGVNGAAWPWDKLRHETVQDLLWLINVLLECNLVPKLWKRDLRKAFRGIPIMAEHLDLSWVVWRYKGTLYVSRHLGMPFGTTSAVYGFHRVGAFLAAVVKRMALAPTLRYVDDFFGASRQGVFWTAGKLLEVISDLVGRPCDPKKSEQDLSLMVVLGIEVAVNDDLSGVRVTLQEAKAKAWAKELECAIYAGVLDAGQAAKFAGRLSFGVHASNCRCGRAYLKPLFAQSVAPPFGGAISPSLRAAMEWWLQYLRLRPSAVQYHSIVKERVRLWTDAAGEEPHVAAVIAFGDELLYCHAPPPQWFVDQLLPRGDNNIGVLEALAVIIGLSTFAVELACRDAVCFVDNQGVLAGFVNGSSRQPETNFMVAQFWFRVLKLSADVQFWRVESKANVSDGPTRQFFDVLQRLGAKEVEVVWPAWLVDVWAKPGEALAW